MIKKLDHVGVAVKSLEEALAFYRDILGLPVKGIIDDPDYKIRIAFVPIGGSEIELMEPTDPQSPVARFIEKRGEGMHHISLEVDDIYAEVERLAAQGVELIDREPRREPRTTVAFLHPRSARGVLVELSQVNE